MSGNQFFHYFDVVTSTLFEQLKVFRTAKPDFSAVNRVQLDDAIADDDLFGGEQEHGFLLPVRRSRLVCNWKKKGRSLHIGAAGDESRPRVLRFTLSFYRPLVHLIALPDR